MGAAAMLAVGLIDDALVLNPRQKLSCQLAIVTWVAIFALPRYAFTPWHLLGVGITIFWLVATTNAFNLVDGLTVWRRGSALRSLLRLRRSASRSKCPRNALSLAVAGALGGFLIFNLPPASIIMGDAGALPLGYMLGVLALQGGALATNSRLTLWVFPVLVMLVPLLDEGIVTAARLATGKANFTTWVGARPRSAALGLTEWRAVASIWAAATVAAGCGYCCEPVAARVRRCSAPIYCARGSRHRALSDHFTFDTSPPSVAYGYLQGVARCILFLSATNAESLRRQWIPR